MKIDSRLPLALAGAVIALCVAPVRVPQGGRCTARPREATWGNLRDVKDIGDAIQTVAKFGRPQPL
jgi:hypothetical protein